MNKKLSPREEIMEGSLFTQNRDSFFHQEQGKVSIFLFVEKRLHEHIIAERNTVSSNPQAKELMRLSGMSGLGSNPANRQID